MIVSMIMIIMDFVKTILIHVHTILEFDNFCHSLLIQHEPKLNN